MLTFQDVNTRNTAIQNTTKSVHNETVRIVDAQLKDMAVQMAALDEFVGRAREQNGRHHTSHCENLGSLATNFQQAFMSADDSLETASVRIQEHTTAVEQDLTSLGDKLSTLSDVIQHPIAELQSTIASNPLTEYKVTGETPQKKNWIYSRNLPRTEAHHVLLARLRGDTGLSPKKSPRKNFASPRKGKSPTKLPSPSKTKVFLDPTHNIQSIALAGGEENKTGLREIDMNILPPQAATTDDIRPHSRPHAPTTVSFSKSMNSSMQPPLKRHATASGETRVHRKGRENQNGHGHGPGHLSQSVGPGMGRRLRSSPQQ